MDREQVVALQHQRFAAKKYDPNRRISQKDWEALVEVGRLAPSSIGLEPWKMLLLKNEQHERRFKTDGLGGAFLVWRSEPFCHLSCAKRRYL